MGNRKEVSEVPKRKVNKTQENQFGTTGWCYWNIMKFPRYQSHKLMYIYIYNMISFRVFRLSRRWWFMSINILTIPHFFWYFLGDHTHRVQCITPYIWYLRAPSPRCTTNSKDKKVWRHILLPSESELNWIQCFFSVHKLSYFRRFKGLLLFTFFMKFFWDQSEYLSVNGKIILERILWK